MVMALREAPYSHTHIPDGTSAEDLAIFLAGWRRYQIWSLREDRARYDVRLIPLLARLEEHLAALREFAVMPVEAFMNDRYKVAAAQHFLFQALGAAIDASKWLAGRVRLRGRPQGFADAFDLLVRAGVLPADKRNVFIGLARFRNWVIHEAISLSPAKARALIRFYLPVLEGFVTYLQRSREN